MPALNLFPVRAPIGSITDSSGQTYDVLMTPEFARALASLMVRVGGPNSINFSDVVALLEDAFAIESLDAYPVVPKEDTDPVPESAASQIAALRAELADLRASIESTALSSVLGQIEQLRAQLTADSASPGALVQIEQLVKELATIAIPVQLSSQIDQLRQEIALADFPQPIQKNAVTGSRGGNAALGSLLGALARSGLIIDNSTI